MKKNWKIKQGQETRKHSSGMFSGLSCKNSKERSQARTNADCTRTNAERIMKKFNVEPIIAKILFNRGICDEDICKKFLEPDYESDLHDPFLLKDMRKAVERVLAAKEKKEKVCVFGDYDADGITSAAVLKDVFDQLGIESFCYIPDRNKEGYGISSQSIEYIKSENAGLVVSVDCGVSNFEEVGEMNSRGMDVVVLDHHHVPEKMPDACAVVNPKQKGDKYPFKELAGVGVVFKFVQALVSEVDDFDAGRLKWLLDLVAIGTIADCVPLLDENRVFAKFGLIVLAKTKRVGLKQLFAVGRMGIDENNFPSSQQVAFQIAPRINAAGRMDHANAAYQLLTQEDGREPEARTLALELESQNQNRQKVTTRIIKEVEDKIAEKDGNEKIIIENSPHWPLGVIGLASGKITDKFNKPSILLKDNGDGTLTGSCRSIPELDIISALEKNKDLLEKFGGHRQAAGVTIARGKLSEFCQKMAKLVGELIPDELLKTIEIDAEIEAEQISEKIIQNLSSLEPFGQGNEQPVFWAKNLEIADKKLIGKTGAHLKLWFKKKGEQPGLVEAVGFGMGEYFEKFATGQKIEAVFNLEEDNWNGNKKIQLRLIDFQA